MPFTLTTPAFPEGETIPVQFTCDGDDRSPELLWREAPEGTQSFALIVHDPDAPRGDFTHWVLFDIPAELVRLPETTGREAPGIHGINDYGNPGWGGPCPPQGHGPHRYYFVLYALDVERLDLQEGAKREEVEAAFRGHILGQASYMGRYQRE